MRGVWEPTGCRPAAAHSRARTAVDTLFQSAVTACFSSSDVRSSLQQQTAGDAPAMSCSLQFDCKWARCSGAKKSQATQQHYKMRFLP